MNKHLVKLKKEFDEYYSTEYSSEKQDTQVNTNIRKKVISILENALNTKDTELADEALCLLSTYTGCAEDLEIFEKLTQPLLDSGALTIEKANIVYNSKAVQRWK